MKLFQRIFATFCAVIICAIFVASFSFWLVQSTVAETRFKQLRSFEASLLRSTVTAFHMRGDAGVREQLQEWGNNPGSENLYVIRGDDKTDIMARPVDVATIQLAHEYAMMHPESPLVQVAYNRLGEEYLFFVRDWDKEQIARAPSPFLIPGLPVAPIWHEFIILSFIVVVGLLTAYILASNITQPIRLLARGMNRLAGGDLETRVSHQLAGRQDELYLLAVQFDRMAKQLQKLVEKERHLLHHVSHEMRSPLARMQAIVGLIQVQPQKQEQHLQRLEAELARMDGLVGELLTLSRLETANVEMEKEPLLLVPFLQQLLDDNQELAAQKQEQHLQRLEAELARMDGLVGELLTLSRLETANVEMEKEPLLLVPFLQQLLDDNQELAAQKQQQLQWQCSIPEAAQVLGNAGYLYRAFDNVLRNAMAYSPEGSTIQLCLREAGKQQWQVDISDNGPGVAETQLPHIFTAFYRADSSANKPGTGLGLALAKHITERHGGKISAANRKPNGLIMQFVLPKWTEKKEDGKKAAANTRAA